MLCKEFQNDPALGVSLDGFHAMAVASKFGAVPKVPVLSKTSPMGLIDPLGEADRRDEMGPDGWQASQGIAVQEKLDAVFLVTIRDLLKDRTAGGEASKSDPGQPHEGQLFERHQSAC